MISPKRNDVLLAFLTMWLCLCLMSFCVIYRIRGTNCQMDDIHRHVALLFLQIKTASLMNGLFTNCDM